MEDLGRDLLGEAVEGTTEKVVEGGTELLASVLAAHGLSGASTLGGPVAAVLAKLAKVLVEKLFEKTSKVEPKLDILLAEPFQTATSILQRVLSAQGGTFEELDTSSRLLEGVYVELEKAFHYAEDKDPEKRGLVQLYQLQVAALMKDAQP